MLASRTAQQALRRLGAQPAALRFVTPTAIATGNAFRLQKRTAASVPVSAATEHDKILAQQRLNRPVAPHLGIYQPQITWYLSALNRVTGCTLSGAFYVFGSLYLVAPYIGLHMESASIAAAFGAWPLAAKVLVKSLAAFPFTFHCFNGLRHLIWDTTSMISNAKVISSGWTVVGLTAVSSVALAMM